MARPIGFRCLAVALALLAIGCDAGYRYKPLEWSEQPQHRWSRTFDGFTLRISPLGGLVGEWWLWPEFEVLGNSQVVTLTSAYLQTSSAHYSGLIDPRAAIAAPGGERLLVNWDFGRGHPAADVLGKRAAIVLDLNVGSRLQRVQIEYEATSL